MNTQLVEQHSKLITGYLNQGIPLAWAKDMALKAMSFTPGNHGPISGRDSRAYGYKTRPTYDWETTPTVLVNGRITALPNFPYETLIAFEQYLKGELLTCNFLAYQDQIKHVLAIIQAVL